MCEAVQEQVKRRLAAQLFTPSKMSDSLWYSTAESRDEISFVRDSRSTLSRRSPSPTRESFGGEVYGERDLDRLESRRNKQRSPTKGVFHEPPDHRRGPTALDASQLRRGGRHGFTGKNGARMGWTSMHLGAAGTTYARNAKGHNTVYSRAYPRTTPSGTHTIYSTMQESHKKGPAADAMADLERFESQTLLHAKGDGAHSFRKLCAKDLKGESDGGDNGDNENEWADADYLEQLINEDRYAAASYIQKIARGRGKRNWMEKERAGLVKDRKEREQARMVRFQQDEERKAKEAKAAAQ